MPEDQTPLDRSPIMIRGCWWDRRLLAVEYDAAPNEVAGLFVSCLDIHGDTVTYDFPAPDHLVVVVSPNTDPVVSDAEAEGGNWRELSATEDVELELQKWGPSAGSALRFLISTEEPPPPIRRPNDEPVEVRNLLLREDKGEDGGWHRAVVIWGTPKPGWTVDGRRPGLGWHVPAIKVRTSP